MIKKISALLVCLLIFTLSVSAANDTDDTATLVDDILAFKLEEAGARSLLQWIEGELTAGAGTKTSEWLIIGLRQYDAEADFTLWADALESFLDGADITAAASRQRYALALIACGRRDSPHVASLSADTVGEGGVMTGIYGLHLLNNGAQPGKTAREVIDDLLSLRMPDGGWALMGKNSDVDITAMAVQALAPHYGEDDVRAAVDGALDLLGEKQLEDGGYRSFGTNNPESPAQVIVALSSLGIDPAEDERFIKNGSTLLDGMLKFRLSDGSFSHTEDGDSNQNATTQVFYSLVSLWHMRSGLSPLYIFDSEPAKNVQTSGGGETEPETEAKAAEEPEENETDMAPRDDETVRRIRTGAVIMVVLVVGVLLWLRKKRR